MARDDFDEQTKRTLEKRVGCRCSNPQCRQPTSGPAFVESAATNVGTASHISAAASGGPRYDPTMDPADRRSISNGIWLCARCSRLIDGDEDNFPVDLLKQWKRAAEERASGAIAGSIPSVGATQGVLLEGVLEGHTNYVWDLAVTSDGRKVFSASNDKTVRGWDARTHAPLCCLGPYDTMVQSVSISADDRYVVIGQLNGVAAACSLSTEQPVREVHHGSSDAKVAFVDSAIFVTGGSDGRLRFWTLTGQLQSEVRAHDGPVLKIVAFKDTLVSSSADRTIAVWDLSETLTLRRRFSGHTGEVNSVAVACDHDRLLSASEDRSVRLWELSTGKCLDALYGHDDIVWRVALSRDCRWGASGSGDNCVCVWDLGERERFARVEHPDCVAAVAFSPHDERLFVGCDDNRVYIYSVDRDALGAGRT